MERKCFANRLLPLFVGMLLTACSSQQSVIGWQQLREGDLLFHVVEKGNAITDVTPGMIDHVAIYLGDHRVVEAVSRGVVVTPLDSLVSQQGHYVVGRVRQVDAKASISGAMSYLGRAYDWVYLYDNDEIYCSELVEHAYVDKRGRKIFIPIPMTFHDSTGLVTPYWEKYYYDRHMAVPVGPPGTNPGEMSARPCVKLLGRLAPQKE